MLITFEAEVTQRGTIMLPEEYRNMELGQVTVVITDEPIASKLSSKKARIMKYAGIWNDLSDEELAEIQKRRQSFFGERRTKL